MDMPIPDDWDGVTWRSLCIHWPDSLQWRAVLRGLLSTPYRGRFWDRDTGSIIAAQNIGKTIIDSNFDFPPCTTLGGGTVKAEKHWIFVSNNAQNTREIAIGTNIRCWDGGAILDDGEGVQLAIDGETFALQTGSYKVRWRCAGSKIGRFGTALVLVQQAMDVFLMPGQPAVSINDAAEYDHYSEGIAVFTVNSDTYPTTMEIRQYAQLANTLGQGIGYAIDGTAINHFGYIEIWKMEDLGELVGEPGPPGPQGAPGPQGFQGPQGLQGVDGPGVLMQATGSVLQWAQEDEPTTWFDLIDLCDLSCPIPENPPTPPIEGACENATFLTLAVKEMLDYEKKAKEENLTLLGLINAASFFYSTFFGPWWAEVATAAVTGFIGLFQGDLLDWYPYVTQTEYDRLKCMFYEAINTWGQWDRHSSTLVRDWIRNERDTYTEEEELYKFWDWAQSTPHVDGSAYQLGYMAGLLAETETPVIDCSECNGGLPEWGAFMLMGQDNYPRGWSFQAPYASFVPGIGMLAYQTPAPDYEAYIQAYLTIPAGQAGDETYIDGIEISYTTDPGTTFEPPAQDDRAFIVNGSNFIQETHWSEVIASSPEPPAGWYIVKKNYLSIGGVPIPQVEFDVFAILLYEGHYTPGTNVILEHVAVSGRGRNPFAELGWDDMPYNPPT